jgi:hypothetical protein
MKKTLLFFLAFIIIIVMYGSGYFANANISMIESDLMQLENERILIENLLKKRIELWNQVYEGDIKLEFWVKQLEKIMTDPLLSSDIKAFKEQKQLSTELDKVLGLTVCHIEDIHYGRNKIMARVTINWRMKSALSQYVEEIQYTIVIKQSDNEWKLCECYIYQ